MRSDDRLKRCFGGRGGGGDEREFSRGSGFVPRDGLPKWKRDHDNLQAALRSGRELKAAQDRGRTAANVDRE